MSPIKRGLLSVLLVVACIVGPGAIAYALWSAPATGTMAVTVESPTATVTTPTTPGVPANFRCLVTPSASPVFVGNDRVLYWNQVTGAQSYVLSRVANTANVNATATARPAGAPTPYATVTPAAPASPSAVVEVVNNRYAWYSVQAVNAAGTSGSSNEVRVRRDGGNHLCAELQ